MSENNFNNGNNKKHIPQIPHNYNQGQNSNIDSNNNDYNDNYYDNEQNKPIYNQNSNNNDFKDIYSNADSGHKHKPSKIKSPKSSSKGKKIFKAILAILLVIILLLGIYAAIILVRIHYSNDNPDTSSVEDEIGELKSDSNVWNIMLFGADNHSENENGRSDSMILLSIDKKHKTLKQTSFLRDMYLTIPGYDKNKLNAAYSYGGAKLAVETIEYNFKIKIDNYAIVDFSSFTSIIDALGGINLNLTYDEIDYIDWQCHKNKQVSTRHELNADSYNYTKNKNGDKVAKVHLNGRQALWYARDRDSAGSDFDRTSRQRIVINTIFAQMKSSNPITLMRVVYEIAPMITTNMSPMNTFSFGANMISYLRYTKKELSVPSSSNYSNAWVDGSEVLQIDDMDSERERLYNFVFNK